MLPTSQPPPPPPGPVGHVRIGGGGHHCARFLSSCDRILYYARYGASPLPVYAALTTTTASENYEHARTHALTHARTHTRTQTHTSDNNERRSTWYIHGSDRDQTRRRHDHVLSVSLFRHRGPSSISPRFISPPPTLLHHCRCQSCRHHSHFPVVATTPTIATIATNVTNATNVVTPRYMLQWCVAGNAVDTGDDLKHAFLACGIWQVIAIAFRCTFLPIGIARVWEKVRPSTHDSTEFQSIKIVPSRDTSTRRHQYQDSSLLPNLTHSFPIPYPRRWMGWTTIWLSTSGVG